MAIGNVAFNSVSILEVKVRVEMLNIRFAGEKQWSPVGLDAAVPCYIVTAFCLVVDEHSPRTNVLFSFVRCRGRAQNLFLSLMKYQSNSIGDLLASFILVGV